MSDTPILTSCMLNGDGSCKNLNEKDLVKALKDDRPAWVHLDGNHPKTRAWLQENVSYLDPLILDALLATETRPRLSEFGEGSLLILRGMNFNEGADPEDMISIRLWVDQHRLISIRRRQLKTVQDLRDKLEKGNGPKTIADLVTQLSYRLFERMEPILQQLDDRIDDIEERILDNPDPSKRQDIIQIRKEAIIFRRYIAPQKEAMNHLRLSDQPWIAPQQKRQVQEALDRTIRYIEDLDAIRERAQIVKDELANMLSDRLNKNLYILSVISAIFLPLGFFTGLMGINIGGMPGVDHESAFWIFSGILLVIVIIQMAVFKILKWF